MTEPTTPSDQADATSGLLNRLCHVLVLTRGTTPSELIERLVLTVLSIDEELQVADARHLAEALDAYFGVRIPEQHIDDAISRLLGRQFMSKDGRWLVVAEPTRRQVLADIAAAAEVQAGVRREWDAANLDVPELARQAIWQGIHSFLAQAFLRHGAETAQLLVPDLEVNPRLRHSFDQLLARTLQHYRDRVDPAVLERAIHQFFENPSALRAKYLAELMDASFTLFALSVDEITAKYLAGNFPRLELFADTNYLFALLGLNDPADIVIATELPNIVRELNLQFRLYYHPATLTELKNTVSAIGQRLKSQAWGAAVSRAAYQSGRFTDLELKFYEQNARQRTDPDAFLLRYLRPERILKDLGFDVHRAQEETEAEARERQEAVAAYDAYLQSRTPPRTKPYATIDHDIRVRAFVRRRQRDAPTILDAGAFMLTMDHVLYRYDWTKLRQRGEVGTTVLPQQLVQLLRPLAHGVADFDKRFVEGFALPEIRSARSFNPAVSTKILSYLSTVSDLNPDTAASLLTDEYLTQAVGALDPRSPEFRAEVDNALARQNAELQQELQQAREGVASMESERSAAAAAYETRIEDLEAGFFSITDRLREAEEAKDREAQERRRAEERTEAERERLKTELESQMARQKADFDKRSHFWNEEQRTYRVAIAGLAWLLTLAVLVALPLVVAHPEWLAGAYLRFTVGLLGLEGGLFAGWAFPGIRKAAVTTAIGVPGLVILEALAEAHPHLPWHI